jgi:hypothetical protein
MGREYAQFAGSHPAEAVGFLGRKNPQHAFLQRGSKAVGFIIQDSCIVRIPFCFDVLEFLYLFCLFCVTKSYIFVLTVHLRIILVGDQLDAQFLL